MCMPRRSRIVLPELAHHVTQRGSRRGLVFFGDHDKSAYLQLLSRYSLETETEVLAYCLMDNHVHLILVPGSENALAGMLSVTHMRYAALVNTRNDWRGHLWQQRFFSSPLDGAYFWSALKYVERNPVRAGIVQRAEQYRWSSAAYHCHDREDAILRCGSVRWAEKLATKACWSAWLAEEEKEDELRLIRERTRKDLPCGDDAFIERLESQLGLKLVRPRGRPKK